uniref:ATP-dependent DNA helicase n=1 Tax=Strongyloides papillosus TaxID=174720 RepID=A0A0N5B5W6_STREA
MMIEGPAGTGKTFLYNLLATYLRTEGKYYINLSGTGIASSLLYQGQTCHSLFEIPLSINDPGYDVKMEKVRRLPDTERMRIKNAEVCFIDEVSMLSAKQLDYIDKVLRLHGGRHKPFGGKFIVMGRDFRQCLPIIKDATTAQLEASTILKTKIFTHGNQVKRQYLTDNMRAGENEIDFARFLLQIGNGQKINETESFSLDGRMNSNRLVTIPNEMIFEGDLEGFIVEIFGLTKEDISNYFNRAILAPTNSSVMDINILVLQK